MMQNNKSKQIIFIGTAEYGAQILEGLIAGGYKPKMVITMPDKPVGRKQILTPPPVKVIAQKYNIPIKQTDKIKNLKLEIKNLKPDLGIVAAYGGIIPKDILDISKYGFINVHPSLLPKYRGPSPIQFAILNGEKENGVTIILIDEKLDHGPIISNSKLVENKTSEAGKLTYQELHDKLAQLGIKLLLETIPKWLNGEIKPRPQDESMTSYTKILKKEDGRINWKKTAEEIERQFRAFNPWPGSYTFWQSDKNTLTRIIILKARTYKFPTTQTYPIGKVLVVPQNEIGVSCKKDFLVIEKLKIEGGKEMTAEDFLRGHQNFVGTILK